MRGLAMRTALFVTLLGVVRLRHHRRWQELGANVHVRDRQRGRSSFTVKDAVGFTTPHASIRASSSRISREAARSSGAA